VMRSSIQGEITTREESKNVLIIATLTADHADDADPFIQPEFLRRPPGETICAICVICG